MARSVEIQAAALVSLDGFTMASALPPGMQEDRVGAMSAAILGLGERAAVELGKGRLTQVFIEGDDGYVLLVNAGVRAVLTVLAAQDAKLGLVLYDMKSAAAEMGEILG
ncbi:MAG: roadblock/LC7 domain-containing protein [Coriobacteriia bacterium]